MARGKKDQAQESSHDTLVAAVVPTTVLVHEAPAEEPGPLIDAIWQDKRFWPNGIEDEIISFAEAGRLVNKSRTTVRMWAQSGIFPIVRHPSGCPAVWKADFLRSWAVWAVNIENRKREAKNREFS
jgi:hypothetical protein